MAQLPYLMYDSALPMSSGEFKELANSFLSRRDASFLKYLSIDLDIKTEAITEDAASLSAENSIYPDFLTGCVFVDNWLSWERTMRLSLARHRSLKLYDEAIEPPVESADAFNTAASVFIYDGSPLDKEILLDKARWKAIDLLTGDDYFHQNNAYAYYLKLLILERRQLFDVEKGFSEYKSIYAEIINNPQGCEYTGDNK